MRIAVLLVAVLAATAARADLFPVESRAIPLGDSASRDAPVVELAYGPTFQASFGGEIGLLRLTRRRFDFRLSVSGLAAFELETSAYPPPDFLRTIVGLTGSFALRPAVLGGTLEISIGVGGAWAMTVGTTEAPAASPGAIPFGGGGLYLLPEAAWRRDFGRWRLTVRVSERLDLPTLLLAVDQRSLADAAADLLDDAFTNVPSADIILRWRVRPRWQPLISVHGEGLFPEDTSARAGGYVRGLLGVAITGLAGEVIPFLSAEVGNGQGLLVNDREARFSVGVRYAAF